MVGVQPIGSKHLTIHTIDRESPVGEFQEQVPGIKWQTESEDSSEKSHPRDDKLGDESPLWPTGLFPLSSLLNVYQKAWTCYQYLKMRDFKFVDSHEKWEDLTTLGPHSHGWLNSGCPLLWCLPQLWSPQWAPHTSPSYLGPRGM